MLIRRRSVHPWRNDDGCVYLARSLESGFVKVGYTSNWNWPLQRVRRLAWKIGHPLEVISIMRAHRSTEALILNHFIDDRVVFAGCTEWIRPSPRLSAFIETLPPPCFGIVLPKGQRLRHRDHPRSRDIRPYPHPVPTGTE